MLYGNRTDLKFGTEPMLPQGILKKTYLNFRLLRKTVVCDFPKVHFYEILEHCCALIS